MQMITNIICRRSDSPITSDKPHYENKLPNGWCLTNIGELLINRDGERKPVSSAIRNKQKNKVYNYYGAAGIIDKVDGYLFNERLLLIGEDGANLLSRSKDNAFFADGKYWVNNHAHVLDAIDKNLLDFVAIVINAMKLDDYITGSAQPKLSQDNLNKIPIALPPLYEQIRIVAKLKYWFSFVDWIEYNKGNLQDTIKQVKSKVLDLAIHGKLVPQDPTDEPASELLKRINPKAEITCDNGHYQKLPEGWCKCSFDDIFNITMGQSPNGCSINHQQGIEFHQGKILFGEKYLKRSDMFTDAPTKLATPNSLLLCVRAPVGVVNITQREICIGRGLCSLKPNAAINLDYAYHTLTTYQSDFESKSTGSTFKAISGSIIRKEVFALPPLKEQHRIVAKIEEIFAQLDAIEASL